MVKALQSFIHPLIGKAQELASARLIEVQQQAQLLMQQKLNAQIERLQALQKLNPSVRPEEIAHLQQQQQELTDYISKARLKFDALRVVVVSHD
jgi:ATP-dependent helicase HepA